DPMTPAPPVTRPLLADQPCPSHARRVRGILPTASVPHLSHTCFRGARGDAAVHHSPRRVRRELYKRTSEERGCYHPPRRNNITGTVRSMIFVSSSADCRRMYSRS